MWFEELVGFREVGPEQVRANLEVSGDRLTSKVNGASYGCGLLTTPTLSELRAAASTEDAGSVGLREVVGNVQTLHLEPTNAGALFQAASQFNLLEMVGPDVTPEAGVGIYGNDHTQGPACAIACGAGTIVRNYFAPVRGGIGQTASRQIDCLEDLGAALGNSDGSLWTMKNGYCLLSSEGLRTVGPRVDALDEAGRDALQSLLRVGVQSDVEVTLGGAGHHVSQVYGSALPVAYGGGGPSQWEPFARLVLEASYEATLLVARANADRSGNRTVFLTLLGGGVFGNPDPWILDSIGRAVSRVSGAGLDVAIVSYGRSKPSVREFVGRSQ
ncbi:MAG: hypothetical protein KDA24_12435 [Deltaproteobacteria bacterium]|nr:hypothetical protein [Deltaproteobacteria bacterium]